MRHIEPTEASEVLLVGVLGSRQKAYGNDSRLATVLNKKAGDQTDFQDPHLFNMQMHALA
jgi:hypothetical protein